MEMKDILDRIDQRKKVVKLTDRKIGLAAGMSGDLIRNWKRRLKEGHVDRVRNIRSLEPVAQVLGVSAQWLMTGEDDVGDNTPLVIRSASPQIVDKLRRIHCFDMDDVTGHGPDLSPEIALYEIGFSPEMLRSLTSASNDMLSLIRFHGDSMIPTLIEGDWFLVDGTRRNIKEEGVFLVMDVDILRIRRIQRNRETGLFTVKTDNPIHGSYDSDEADITVLGRVIWVGRRI